MKTRHERLENFLKSLGNTSDEVAAKLRKWGIKGKQWDGRCCPLTNACKKKFRGFSGHTGYLWVDATPIRVQMTRVLREFVTRYDRGDFPDLNQ
jgi:hypothetical protein